MSKKIKLIQVGDIEPSCPKCRMSNAMLNEFKDKLKCRDCGYVVEVKNIEIEIVTRDEALKRGY